MFEVLFFVVVAVFVCLFVLITYGFGLPRCLCLIQNYTRNSCHLSKISDFGDDQDGYKILWNLESWWALLRFSASAKIIVLFKAMFSHLLFFSAYQNPNHLKSNPTPGEESTLIYHFLKFLCDLKKKKISMWPIFYSMNLIFADSHIPRECFMAQRS